MRYFYKVLFVSTLWIEIFELALLLICVKIYCNIFF